LAQEVEMGLLDFDINQVLDNKAFQLGTNILGNNTGHYGQFGPALQGGLNDYQKQQLAVQKRQQELLRQQDEQLAREALAAQSQRLGNVRKQFADNPYAQLDPMGHLKSERDQELEKIKTGNKQQWDLYLEQAKSNMSFDNKQKEQDREFNYEQYGTPTAPGASQTNLPISKLPGSATTPKSQFSNLPFKTRMKLGGQQAEAKVKSKQKRLDTLNEGATSRRANIVKAKEFLNKFKHGFKDKDDKVIPDSHAQSGLGRNLLNWIPTPTYTKQGQFDELFNAFAETAARQKLKASGEIRPTDADVKGMKEAIFGVGRDENVNIQLLEEFIRENETDEAEYLELGGSPEDPNDISFEEFKRRKAAGEL